MMTIRARFPIRNIRSRCSLLFSIYSFDLVAASVRRVLTHTHNRTLYSSEIKIEKTMSSGQITFQHFYRCPSSARCRALIFLSPTKTSCLRIYFHKLFSLSLSKDWKIRLFPWRHSIRQKMMDMASQHVINISFIRPSSIRCLFLMA